MRFTRIRQMIAERSNRETLYSTPGYWDAKANAFDGDAASMWPNNRLNHYYHLERLRVLAAHLPNVQGLDLLDVGCGTGRMSRYFAERGANVVGVDFSREAIAIAQSNFASGGPHYRLQSLFDLDDNGVFDIAFSWAALAMACRDRAELQNVLLRLKGALRPNGKVLFVEPIHRGFLHRVLSMDVHEFCQVMCESGLVVQNVAHLCFWPTRLALAYVNWPGFVTAAGYYVGDAIMSLAGRRAWGDYQAIFASSAGS